MYSEENPREGKKTVRLTEVVSTTLRHWPWIVVSVMVCVILAALYALHKQPIYQRDATIVLRDDSQGGGSISSQFSMFASMGMMGSGMNIRDEINKLLSPDLMTEVVKRLDLQTDYNVEGRFRMKSVYRDSIPVKVNLPELKDEDYLTVAFSVSKDGEILLKSLSKLGAAIDFRQSKPAKFGETIKTPVGNLTVVKGPNFEPGKKLNMEVNRYPLRKAVTMYSGAVDIKLQDQFANTIEMSMLDRSKDRAEDVLNSIIDVYNENWVINRNEVSDATTKFINDRLVSLEKELGGVDKEISEYQSANLVPNVASSAQIYLEADQKAEQQILLLSNQLQMARYMRDYLSSKTHEYDVLPANSGIGNPSIESQIQMYNNKLMARNRLAANSSENHPTLVNLDNEVKSMREAIVSAVDNEMAMIGTRIRNYESEQMKTRTNLSKTPGQANYLLGIGRQQKVKENLYLFLLQKREENELNRAFTAYNTEVIARPYGENAPVSPRKVLIVAFAFMFGLCLPFGYTFVYEMLNTRVRKRKDLDKLKVPVIGEIPKWTPSKRDLEQRKAEGLSPVIAVEDGNRNVVNDAFRILRSNLRFVTGQREGATLGQGALRKDNVIMITSMHAGSGKSFVSVNLAISLGLRRKKVLIIDADLRHGSSSEVVGSPSKGISEYLSDNSDDASRYIVSGRLPGDVDVLPVGKFPPNPAELLDSVRFRELVDLLRQQYDYILIDCPPTNNMADATIIATLADRCLYVIRVGLFRLEDLELLDKMYKENQFKHMAVILNGTTEGNGSKYGYADNYHKN